MTTPGERLAQARKKAGFKSAREAALHYGWKESSYRAHEKSTRTYDLEAAGKYAAAFDVDPRWLRYGENIPGNMVDTRSPVLPNATLRREMLNFTARRLPVFGRAVGGDDGHLVMNGEIIDHVECPPGLDSVPNAYAVYVIGDSMEPRYHAGEVVYLHPARPVKKGDYVVVQTRGPEGEAPLGFIKRFVAYTPTRLILSQLNPPREIEFERADVVSVHKIVFAGES